MFLLTLLLLKLLTIQAQEEGFECYDTLKITNLVIILRTSSAEAADSTGENPSACVEDSNGFSRCVLLENLDGHDMMYEKASWWDVKDFNGLNVCDITNFKLKANSGDGFGFVTCSVVAETNDGKAHVMVHWNGDTKWLDTDNEDQKEQAFDIEPTFGYPKGETSQASVIRIHIFAESDNDSDSKTIAFHLICDHVEYSEILTDNWGNDGEVDRTDYWHFADLYFLDFLDVGHITSFSFRQDGDSDDAWAWRKALVYFQTTKGYYVSNLDRTRKSVDGDEGEDAKEAFLDFLPNWNEEVFAPSDYTSGGHWELWGAVDPVDVRSLSMKAEFTDENGVINEDEQMNGYSDTYSQGGSFQFCEKSGISEGGFSAEESACSEFDWNHDHSTNWEQTSMHSVEHRTSESVSYEWKEEIHCDQDESCYVFQWVSMTVNDKTKKVRELATMDVEIIMTNGNRPLCPPGQCVQRTDCQTCWDSPNPDLIEPDQDDHDALASTGETTFEYMSSYWVYAGLIFMAFFAGTLWQKYHVEKLESEKQYLDMARLDVVSYST